MAVITIASATLPNWELSSDVQLRIYPLQSFVSADGNLNEAGNPNEDASVNDNYYQVVTCSLSGTTLTISSCTLESTTDALDITTAKYGAFFFTTEGQNLGAFAQFAAFALAASPTSTTWHAIAVADGL